MKHPFALSPPLVAITFILNACGGGGGNTANSHPTNDPAAPDASSGEGAGPSISAQDINRQNPADLRKGGEFRLPIDHFPENWNPRHVDGSNARASELRAPLLPAFFDFDGAGNPTPNPDYLLSVDVIDDNPTVVRYRLNPEAVWGDGSPVDGDDMRASWLACNGKNEAFNCASTEQFAPIADISFGEDKTNVTVSYSTTFPDWSQGFSRPAVVKAESVADAETFNNGWASLKNEWLSGPFKVAGIDRTQQVVTLVPNERWWGEAAVLERIIWRTIATDAQAQAFANDEIDAFDIGSDPDAYQRAARVSDADIRKAGGPDFRHLTFNSRAGLLTDLVIRRAIVHGLDRASIAASDLAGIDWPAVPLNNHIFLAGQKGYVDTAAATGLDYAPDKARALLDEAGWTPGPDGIREKDGEKLVVRFTQIASVKVSENEALQAQSQLREIGIQLDIVTIPSARFGKTLSRHEFELIAFSWIGTPYPFSGIKQLYGTGSQSNYAQLSMPQVDELARQIAIETDTAKRIALANQADRIIWENVHTLPLYQRPELIATRATLANYGAFGLGSARWEHIGYLP